MASGEPATSCTSMYVKYIQVRCTTYWEGQRGRREANPRGCAYAHPPEPPKDSFPPEDGCWQGVGERQRRRSLSTDRSSRTCLLLDEKVGTAETAAAFQRRRRPLLKRTSRSSGILGCSGARRTFRHPLVSSSPESLQSPAPQTCSRAKSKWEDLEPALDAIPACARLAATADIS